MNETKVLITLLLMFLLIQILILFVILLIQENRRLKKRGILKLRSAKNCRPKTTEEFGRDYPISKIMEENSVLVYSKSSGLLRVLYFENVIDEDGNEFKDKFVVSNDEGYFKKPWEEIDGWISMAELKKYIEVEGEK